jgi:hypothetical protein
MLTSRTQHACLPACPSGGKNPTACCCVAAPTAIHCPHIRALLPGQAGGVFEGHQGGRANAPCLAAHRSGRAGNSSGGPPSAPSNAPAPYARGGGGRGHDSARGRGLTRYCCRSGTSPRLLVQSNTWRWWRGRPAGGRAGGHATATAIRYAAGVALLVLPAVIAVPLACARARGAGRQREPS